MAITKSGLFVVTFIDNYDTTQLAVDLDLETHKIALWDNSITPNFSTNTAYAVSPFNAGEIAGTGYTAGGALLTGTTVTESPTETAMWDANDSSWPTSTLSAVRAAVAYLDALAGNNLFCLWNFGADYATSGSTLAINWATGGLVAWDLA